MLKFCLNYFYFCSRSLIRIIVTRCDIDLGNIKREYEEKFGRSLQSDVSVIGYINLFVGSFLKHAFYTKCFSFYRVIHWVITKKHFLHSSPELTLQFSQKINPAEKQYLYLFYMPLFCSFLPVPAVTLDLISVYISILQIVLPTIASIICFI